MTTAGTGSQLTRRSLLKAAGLTGAAGVAAGVAVGPGTALAAPQADHGRPPSGSPRVSPVAGLHLQFGHDASAEMTVSWQTAGPVRHARVLAAPAGHEHQTTRSADERRYTDAKSGETVHVQHVRLTGLRPNTEYQYLAVHDGAQPQLGTFRTAPRGRAPFTFTSFGDQGTPTLGKRYQPPAGVTIANPPYVNDNLGSPFAGDTTAGVERLAPLLHLFNGDLCYANLAQDRVRTWSDFWGNNTRSARNRPWMPAAGNHENELGNGAFGFRAYQTYFSLPSASGQTEDTRGLWYAFTVAGVRFVSINNDDVCYQDGGNSYVRGYSRGAQRRWLEQELRRSRADRAIDWIVVCMHQVAISTADQANGADLGVREEWVPLFDRYGVDLVVCGHEHHYERSHPIRGREANRTLTPRPAATRTDVVDTTAGTVHMVIGGGGTSVTSNQLLTTPPRCRVITGVGPVDPATGKRPPIYVGEAAPWSARRDAENSYGFAHFAVAPGQRRGGSTTMTVTYYAVDGPFGELTAIDEFTLRRPRTD